MFSRKKLATFAATAAVALGLVGLGTSAQFSDAVTAQQDITAGTAQLAITSAPGGEVAPDGKSVTYTLANTGSLFYEYHWLNVSNVGTLPMHNVTMSINGGGDPALTDNVTAFLGDWEGVGSNWFAGGTVTDMLSRPQPVTWTDYTLEPAGTGYHETAGFFLQFYPNDYWSGGLPNSAQGKAMSVTVTINAVEGIGTEPWYSDGMYLTADTADGRSTLTPGTELKEPFVP
jgi:predicted ribosomally synthesized peptide with SipW-like signal peptide